MSRLERSPLFKPSFSGRSGPIRNEQTSGEFEATRSSMACFDALPDTLRRRLSRGHRAFSPEAFLAELNTGGSVDGCLTILDELDHRCEVDHYGRLMREIALDVPYGAPFDNPDVFYEHSGMDEL